MNINYFMNEAIKEAKLAFNNNEVPVGGVLIDNKTNEIIKHLANELKVNENAIINIVEEIATDPYTEFIFNVWCETASC